MDICTIIAKNYVAYARVLARSFAEHHPGGRVWTLVIDDYAGYINPAEEPFELLTPADIGCEPFMEMAVRYSVLEFSTAVKPWLLRHLIGKTGGPVTYLDPDIMVYGSLEPLSELAAAHGIVLIPHNNEPMPPDGRRPSQVDIMISGVYNLGYVSVASRPEVDRLLDWWADRLRRDCRVDPIWGYFVDQRWFDLTPGFLTDLAIVRDPEYNVAYWNVHARRLEQEGGRYLVDGRPLAFFHFSGFDPEHPLVLSRHQDRVDVADHPVLERLLAEYASEVLRQGHAVSRGWPYTFEAFADGEPLDPELRALYDTFLEELNGRAPSPFTIEGVRVFDEWLKQQAPGAPSGVNRVLAHVYEHRADVRAAFPDAARAGGIGLLRWAEEFGRREIPALARVMGESNHVESTVAPVASVTRPGSGLTGLPSAPLRDAPWGVNIVGYFRSEPGIGEATRRVLEALDKAGGTVWPIDVRAALAAQPRGAGGRPLPFDAPFPVNLICVDAQILGELATRLGEDFFAGRYSIGLCFWDVSRFPDRWREPFSLLEAVWAPSSHVASALEPIASGPVKTVRIPVVPRPAQPGQRRELGLSDEKFLFLFGFDYQDGFERKNPLAVIAAFRRAFDPGDGAGLVIRCTGAERAEASNAQLRAAVEDHPDIEVLDLHLSATRNEQLAGVCDCYVSLHRAEAFGLAIAEAMWRGKPVIATGYSGNLDYMTASNSLLADYRPVPIGPGNDPYPAEGEWADPDVEHAATLMRKVFDDREGAAQLGARAAADIKRTHSPETAGELMRRELESIRATGRARRAAPRVAERPRSLAELPLRIRQGSARSATGPARELARKLLLRAMRPFIVYQQEVNTELVAALEEAHDSILELRQEILSRQAELLHELRRRNSLDSHEDD